MSEELKSFVREMQSGYFKERLKGTTSQPEELVKQQIILRMFSLLGWNPFKDLIPQYDIIVHGEKRKIWVDYAIIHQGQNIIFIEVKKVGDDLGKHVDQLIEYSYKAGVNFAILTDGFSWWFYLPKEQGNWDLRKFYVIDIDNQELEEISNKFNSLLHKDYVISGQAYRTAKELYESRLKKERVNATIPTAWDRILSEPDELLVDLLIERTESICGFKPDISDIKVFIKNKAYAEIRPIIQEMPKRIVKEYAGTKIRSAKKKIESFVFYDNTYKVSSWREMLLIICRQIFNQNKSDFHKVLSLHGRSRPYFSENPKDLREPLKINGTKYFTEGCLSANSVYQRVNDVIKLFNYDVKKLEIFPKP